MNANREKDATRRRRPRRCGGHRFGQEQETEAGAYEITTSITEAEFEKMCRTGGTSFVAHRIWYQEKRLNKRRKRLRAVS